MLNPFEYTRVPINMLILPERECRFPNPSELPAWEIAFHKDKIPAITLDGMKVIDGLKRVLLAKYFGLTSLPARDISVELAEQKIKESHQSKLTLIKRLRERSGISLLKCKRVLEAANWRFDNALAILRSEYGSDFRIS